mmetsp:Transcript_101577/g.270115  ORF Transcript_101577/g.270115 Transcript_101577/m.270115 type:complete len:243 (+) Transcript_101577:346-1074(+)
MPLDHSVHCWILPQPGLHRPGLHRGVRGLPRGLHLHCLVRRESRPPPARRIREPVDEIGARAGRVRHGDGHPLGHDFHSPAALLGAQRPEPAGPQVPRYRRALAREGAALGPEAQVSGGGGWHCHACSDPPARLAHHPRRASDEAADALELDHGAQEPSAFVHARRELAGRRWHGHEYCPRLGERQAGRCGLHDPQRHVLPRRHGDVHDPDRPRHRGLPLRWHPDPSRLCPAAGHAQRLLPR